MEIDATKNATKFIFARLPVPRFFYLCFVFLLLLPCSVNAFRVSSIGYKVTFPAARPPTAPPPLSTIPSKWPSQHFCQPLTDELRVRRQQREQGRYESGSRDIALLIHGAVGSSILVPSIPLPLPKAFTRSQRKPPESLTVASRSQ